MTSSPSTARPPDTRRLHGIPTDERFAGLSAEALALVREGGRHLTSSRVDEAERALESALALAPDHPEALRLMATVLHKRGRLPEAIEMLKRAHARQPDDALVLHHLAASLMQAGQLAIALPMLRRACELAPELGSAWMNLGTGLDMAGLYEESEAAFRRAVQCDPNYFPAHIAHGNSLRAIGRVTQAVEEYRRALALNPESVGAWAALSDFKTIKFTPEDIEEIKRLRDSPKRSERDRAILGFALGKGLEDQERYADALAAFHAANAAWRGLSPKWDRDGFTGFVDRIMEAFARAPAGASDATLGHEVIFVVSLPRSGSTLTEQILSTHSEVEGAGERHELPIVIDEESRRRGVEFPQWVADATPQDWERLGKRYLELTARWRQRKPRSTDKALTNWLYIGAAHAMLPGARFVNGRRDAFETAWSIYKHLFFLPVPFAYDFDEIGIAWRQYDRLMCFWHAHYPGCVYDHVHEELIANPETQVRRLLDFCGLAFERACLRAHENPRSVATASAAQVRQPLRGDTAKTHLYGELLAPLKRSLEL
ncbi:MAG TPA: sulfotransferase [Rhodanobacteraceae bacterium]